MEGRQFCAWRGVCGDGMAGGGCFWVCWGDMTSWGCMYVSKRRRGGGKEMEGRGALAEGKKAKGTGSA